MTIPSLLENIRTADWIFSILTQSLFILAVGWILTRLFKHSSAPLRSGIILTAMVLLVIVPLSLIFLKTNNNVFYRLSIPSVQKPKFENLFENNSALISKKAAQTNVISIVQEISKPKQGTEGQEAKSYDFRAINIIIILLNGFGLIWMVGSTIFLFRFFYGIFSLQRFKSSLLRVEDEGLADILNEVQKMFKKAKFKSIYTSPVIDSPIAVGIFHPVIVFPHSLYQKVNDAELKSILIHELAHIHHRDHLSGILQRIVLAFYWWNPLVYGLSATFSLAREYVSDNYAIQKNGAYPYARCLVALAQKTSLVSFIPAAIGMSTPHTSLEQRIKNIISRKRSTATNLKKPAVFFLTLSSIAFTIFLARYHWTFVAEVPERVIPLPASMKPIAVSVDKGQIFITEETSASILSLDDFSLQKKFDTRGEVLEKHQTFSLLTVFDDFLWANNFGKVMMFSRDGVFQKEMRLHFINPFMTYPTLPVGENYVSFPWDEIKKGRLLHFGRIYDQKFQLLRQFYEAFPLQGPPPPPPPPPPPGSKVVVLPKYDFQVIADCIDFAVEENKIFLADTRKGFFISVFDSQGNLLYVVNKKYKKLKVPEDFEENYMKMLKESGMEQELKERVNFQFRDYYPAFYSFKIKNKKIYVATYAQKNNFHELIVLNLKGDVLKRTYAFPLHPPSGHVVNYFILHKNEYDIDNDKIYYLVYNYESDSYELHIHEIK